MSDFRSYLIKDAELVNEGRRYHADVLVRKGRIDRIDGSIPPPAYAHEEIHAEGMWLMPGVIDDQVHFREPGLTHKAEIRTEARAAVAGGVTSYMEMPNTNPQSVTQALLEDKYRRASEVSLANYSFHMGATNDNLEELKRTNHEDVCGVKAFLGSSTGNMLVDDPETLEHIFSEVSTIISIHSESEPIIRRNLAEWEGRYGANIPMQAHPEIRSVEACYVSTERAIALARKYNTRLNVLHISTAEELALFDKGIPLRDKRITAEVCVHHLWYDSRDYVTLGGLIKCNPAIKEQRHKEALFPALLDDVLDIIATDHAPHTWDEKQQGYLNCPSGLPLVQHPLLMMLDFHAQGRISLEKIVEKMSHAPAECFRMVERGYLREGYWADMILVNPRQSHKVSKENIYYKCGWSPLEGHTFPATIHAAFVSGSKAYQQGKFFEIRPGERLKFERDR